MPDAPTFWSKTEELLGEDEAPEEDRDVTNKIQEKNMSDDDLVRRWVAHAGLNLVGLYLAIVSPYKDFY